MKPVERLSIIAKELRPGQRYIPVASDSQDILAIWPNPVYPEPDDHKTPHERMAEWERRYDCRVHQLFDPIGIEIEKLWPHHYDPRHDYRWIGE